MRVMRVGLAFLAVGQLVPGLWALARPEHFYATFPGVGSAWVAADGPFNHHLVVDAGAGLTATGVALGLAALWNSRRVRVVALVAYLVHAVPHLAYHAGHPPATMGAVEQTMTWLPLAGGVVLAVGLLMASTRQRGPKQSPRIRPSTPATTNATTHAADVPGASDAASDAPTGHGAGQPIAGISGRPRNLLLLAGFAGARRRLGAVPAAWRVTARVPRVALARMAGDVVHQRSKLVPAHIGALASLRAATVVDCAFCIDILSATATTQGVRAEQVRELRRWSDSHVFDEGERLALRLADAMTQTPAAVDDDLRDALVTLYGVDGVIELACAIGHENARARANRALGVPAQGFSAASACPLPTPAGS